MYIISRSYPSFVSSQWESQQTCYHTFNVPNFSSVKKLFRIVAYMYRWIPSCKSENSLISPGILTVKEIEYARKFWIRFVQDDEQEQLQESTSTESGSKIHGRYKRLSPFKDDEGIWRVGLRMREYTPFTADGKPPAFLPHGNRLTSLLMEQAHSKKHSGIDDTVSQFQTMGYWTTKAANLARIIKSR